MYLGVGQNLRLRLQNWIQPAWSLKTQYSKRVNLEHIYYLSFKQKVEQTNHFFIVLNSNIDDDDDDDKRIYQLKTLYLDVKEGVINTCNFDETKWEFNDEKHNLYLEIDQKTGSLQDIFILEKTCFLLDKEKMHQLEIKEKQGKKRELEEREQSWYIELLDNKSKI